MNFKYDPLLSLFKQPITCTRDGIIVHVRPHVLKFGTPVGNIKFQLFDSKGFLLNESAEIAAASVSATLYAHGNVKLDTDYPLKSGISYELGLAAGTGYVYSPTNHIGLVRANPDFRKVPKTYTFGRNEFVFELWERDPMSREIDFFDGFTSSQAPTSGEQITIANNTGPFDFPGIIFDSNFVHRARLAISFFRRTDTQSKKEEAVFEISFDDETNLWKTVAEGQSHYDEAGVTMSVVAATGQVRGLSNDLTGANYNGYAIVEEIIVTKAGV